MGGFHNIPLASETIIGKVELATSAETVTGTDTTKATHPAGVAAAIAARSGGATLNGITAATADQAGIANADWNVRWNWAKITNTEVAFELGESVAATGGTSTSGVPNQVLAKFSTLAASTMSPLSVYSRGSHVFSVSPTTKQILSAAGTTAAPVYAFDSDPDTGIGSIGNGNQFGLVAGGAHIVTVKTTGLFNIDGTAAAPCYSLANDPNTGLYSAAADALGIAVGGVENSRFVGSALLCSYGAANSLSYAINVRKSRGTVAAPTVITTGDDLLDINAYGYVGATNTYQLAASIKFDSTGAISDSATGIGGIIRFNAATVGAEPVECCSVQSGSFVTKGYTVATLPVGVTGAIVHVTDQLTAPAAKGVAPTGGGAVVCMVFYNGTAWVGI